MSLSDLPCVWCRVQHYSFYEIRRARRLLFMVVVVFAILSQKIKRVA
jgi:hypothetical protein